MSLMRSILLAGSQSRWLERQATSHGFVRRAVSRFMPGESLDDALGAAQVLRAQGISTILTHLGENIRDRSEAAAEVEHYVGSLERIRATGLDAEVSIKPTQLGLDLDERMATENTLDLARRANALGIRLWVDMEGTPYTEATVRLYRRLREAKADVGLALQAYLHRTAADVDALLPLSPAIRVVKGAYREPPELAIQSRREIDERFFGICQRLLGEEGRQAKAWCTVGTHDPALIARIEAWMSEHGVAKNDIEFALLYGIQTAEQFRLAAAGYRVRVLISYGSHWFPWYMRRLAEKPSNMLLVARNAFGGNGQAH